ncbi:hypothetical protein [Micromonospora sp. NPDC049240]|uniref:hypothetical protein n=1 Tax=Micromonospora sp. NPDC049240 TaxID=3155151 RepID=UPI0033F543DF
MALMIGYNGMERTTRGGDPWLFAVILPTLISLVLIAFDARLLHWYMIPVTICGMLVAPDVVDWAARRLDTFDPRALVGLFGFHFFYLAPILHVMLDYWPRFIDPLPDWKAGLGAMATLNVLGLCVYRVVLNLRVPSTRSPRIVRKLNDRVFVQLGWLAFAVGLAGFVAVIIHFGGLSGYVSAAADDRDSFIGYGWLLLIGESFPLVGFVVAVVRFRVALTGRPATLSALFLVFAITQFAVGGLRGSRSNTIWPLLIGLIVVHLAVRPVTRRALAAMGISFLVFMYAYGVYKSAGSEILFATKGTTSVTELGDETGRTMPTMLLGDLGRSDIQAVLLHHERAGYAPLSYGVTYVGAAAFMIPDASRPEWMRDKVQAGTDMLMGTGAFDSGWRSSRIYGLAGEALLNFGPAGSVASFAVLAAVVRTARRRYLGARLSRESGVAVMSGIAGVIVILALGSDLDNLLWYLVKTALPLVTVVFFSRRTHHTSPHDLARVPPHPAGPVRDELAGRHRRASVTSVA